MSPLPGTWSATWFLGPVFTAETASVQPFQDSDIPILNADSSLYADALISYSYTVKYMVPWAHTILSENSFSIGSTVIARVAAIPNKQTTERVTCVAVGRDACYAALCHVSMLFAEASSTIRLMSVAFVLPRAGRLELLKCC